MGMGGEICCLLILQMNTINSCEYIPSTSKILIRKKFHFDIWTPGKEKIKRKELAKFPVSFYLSITTAVDAGMLCVHVILHVLDAAVEYLVAVVML